jgi:hypothetical protein
LRGCDNGPFDCGAVGGGVGLGVPAEEKPHASEARRINNTAAVLEQRKALQERRHIDRGHSDLFENGAGSRMHFAVRPVG